MARDKMSKQDRDLANTQASWEGRPRPGESSGGAFRGFVNLDLSNAQKEAFPAWLDSQDLGQHLAFYCTGGVVVSVKVDSKSGGFLASATDKGEGSRNAGLATTARARDPLTALQRLLYILAILGDDWEASQPVANPDRW